MCDNVELKDLDIQELKKQMGMIIEYESIQKTYLADNEKDNQLIYRIKMSVDIGNGSFEYIEGLRSDYVNAYKAVTETNNWEFVKNYSGSFMVGTEREIYQICEKMESLGSSHSGASFATVMRSMQFLAKNGEEKFKQLISN